MRSAATLFTSASRAFSRRTVSEGSATRNTVCRPRFARKWMGNAAMVAARLLSCCAPTATHRQASGARPGQGVSGASRTRDSPCTTQGARSVVIRARSSRLGPVHQTTDTAPARPDLIIYSSRPIFFLKPNVAGSCCARAQPKSTCQCLVVCRDPTSSAAPGDLQRLTRLHTPASRCCTRDFLWHFEVSAVLQPATSLRGTRTRQIACACCSGLVPRLARLALAPRVGSTPTGVAGHRSATSCGRLCLRRRPWLR